MRAGRRVAGRSMAGGLSAAPVAPSATVAEGPLLQGLASAGSSGPKPLRLRRARTGGPVLAGARSGPRATTLPPAPSPGAPARAPSAAGASTIAAPGETPRVPWRGARIEGGLVRRPRCPVPAPGLQGTFHGARSARGATRASVRLDGDARRVIARPADGARPRPAVGRDGASGAAMAPDLRRRFHLGVQPADPPSDPPPAMAAEREAQDGAAPGRLAEARARLEDARTRGVVGDSTERL